MRELAGVIERKIAREKGTTVPYPCIVFAIIRAKVAALLIVPAVVVCLVLGQSADDRRLEVELSEPKRLVPGCKPLEVERASLLLLSLLLLLLLLQASAQSPNPDHNSPSNGN